MVLEKRPEHLRNLVLEGIFMWAVTCGVLKKVERRVHNLSALDSSERI